MFYKRLAKALKQNFKTTREVIDWCREECSKNSSDRKCTDYQCIAEYLIYNIEHNTQLSFGEYQEVQFKEIWGN